MSSITNLKLKLLSFLITCFFAVKNQVFAQRKPNDNQSLKWSRKNNQPQKNIRKKKVFWKRQVKESVNMMESVNNHSQINCDPDSMIEEKEIEEKWTSSGFENVKVDTIPGENLYDYSKVEMTHEFTLTSIIFNDSLWKEGNLDQSYKATAEILAQCGIKIKQVRQIYADFPFENKTLYNNMDSHENVPNSTFRLTELAPTINKPASFYVDGLKHPTKPDFISNGSSRPGHLHDGQSSKDTIYVSAKSFSASEASQKGNTCAHELIHLFTREGHVEGEEDNLMHSDPRKNNFKLTNEQCEKIKTSDLLQKIN